MAYPVLDSAHVTEGVAHLTDHYRNKIVIPGVMKSFLASVQELENVFWDIINKFLLANSPTGDQLRQIGRLVGAQYHGESDADFLQLVLIQIRVNRSQGLSEDIIQVADLALRGVRKSNYVEYVDTVNNTFLTFVIPRVIWPAQTPVVHVATQVNNLYLGCATFLVECLQLQNPNGIAGALSKTRSLGCRGELHYSTWAPGNDFLLISRQGGKPAGQGVWGSRQTSLVGSNMLAGAEV